MTVKYLALPTLLAAALAAWAAVGYARPDRAAELAKDFGGAEGLETLRHPDKVTAVRLELLPAEGPRGRVAADHPPLGEPVAVPPKVAAEVAKLLTDPASYDWGVASGCLPDYGMRLTFARGADRVDVLVCYGCAVLRAERNGKVTGGGLFGPARAPLARVAKTLFPEGEPVRSLEK